MKSTVVGFAVVVLSLAPTGALLAQPDAALTVEGELRVLAPDGSARLWGRGRLSATVYSFDESTGTDCEKNGITFGLSHHCADWGSAADACPIGTWVCESHEIGECDTDRPDGSYDWATCDGTFESYPPSMHGGWVAGASASSTLSGRVRYEHLDGTYRRPTCDLLPVWCCWE